VKITAGMVIPNHPQLGHELQEERGGRVVRRGVCVRAVTCDMYDVAKREPFIGVRFLLRNKRRESWTDGYRAGEADLASLTAGSPDAQPSGR